MALRELTDLLDLPGIAVTGYRKGQDEIRLFVELEKASATCPHCGVRSTRRHSQKPVMIRDLPCFGRRVFLAIPRRRFKCRGCEKPFTEHLGFVEFATTFTGRYEEYLYQQCYERSLASVARQEGISDTVLRKIYESHSPRNSIPRGRPVATRVLGIDEISARKGHRDFLCIISDIDRSKVIEVLPNRLKISVVEYLRGLPPSVKRSLRYVSIDMWEGYYQAVVEALPKKVKVVIDRFHVMKQLNAALTKCRREIQRGMKSKEERDKLKGLRWVLVKNEENLNEEERQQLQQLYETCPQLKTCHELKEEFRRIFDQETRRKTAQKKLAAWKERVKATGLKCLEKFVRTLDNWEEWILNYFTSGKVTNGAVEGLNTKIKLIKRRGYGYRNKDNFRQRILVECGGKNGEKNTPQKRG